MTTGVLKPYCIHCLCEWHIDMEEFEPNNWRAVDPEDRINMDLCNDCGAMLTMPERIQAQ